MSNFIREDLERIYNTTFTEIDVEIINNYLLYDTEKELIRETRYFNNLESYVDYVYLSDFLSAKSLVDDLITFISEVQNSNLSIMDLVISDSNDIELPNNRYIMVID